MISIAPFLKKLKVYSMYGIRFSRTSGFLVFSGCLTWIQGLLCQVQSRRIVNALFIYTPKAFFHITFCLTLLLRSFIAFLEVLCSLWFSCSFLPVIDVFLLSSFENFFLLNLNFTRSFFLPSILRPHPACSSLIRGFMSMISLTTYPSKVFKLMQYRPLVKHKTLQFWHLADTTRQGDWLSIMLYVLSTS